MATHSRQFRLVAVIALLMLQVFAWHGSAHAAVTGHISLDQPYYEGPSSTAHVTLFDSDQTVSVTLQVTSTSDPTGYALTLTGSGIYSERLRFGAVTDAATKTIKVADGDTVTVVYDDPAAAAGPLTVTDTAIWYNRTVQPEGDSILFDNTTPAAATVVSDPFTVNTVATVKAYADAGLTNLVASAAANGGGGFQLSFHNATALTSIYLVAEEAGVPPSLPTRVDAATTTTPTPDATKITYDPAANRVKGLAGAVGAGDQILVTITGDTSTIERYRETAGPNGSFDVRLWNTPVSVTVQAQTAGPNGRQFLSAAITPMGAGDTTPPAAPTGLTLTPLNNKVVLNWSAVTDGDLAGYNVYRTSSPGGTVKLNTALVTGTTYTDATAQNNTLYSYYIKAVDTAGNESNQISPQLTTPTGAITVSLSPATLGQGYAVPTTVTVTATNVEFTAAAPTVQVLPVGGGPVATTGNITVLSASQFTFDLSTQLDRGEYQVTVTSGTQSGTASLSVTEWPVCGGGRTTRCITSFTVDGFSKLGDPTVTLQVWEAGSLQIQILSGGNYDLGALAGATFEIGLNTGAFDPISLSATGDVSLFTVVPAPGNNTLTFRATPRASAWLTSGCSIGSCGNDATRADTAYSAMLIVGVSQMETPPGLSGATLADFTNFRSNARGTYIATNAQAFSAPYIFGGAFRFDVAAPHLKPDGSINSGFFTAFLPNTLLQNYWGLPDPAAAHLVIERTDGSNTTVVAPTVTPAAGGLKLNLSAFSYSSPPFSIKPAEPSAEPPADVTNVTVLPGDGKLTVSFTPPAGGTFQTGKIYVRTLGAGTWTFQGASATGAPVTIDGLSGGTAYEVNIRSVGTDGTEYTPGVVANNSAAGYVPTLPLYRLEADFAVPAGVTPAAFAAGLQVSAGGFTARYADQAGGYVPSATAAPGRFFFDLRLKGAANPQGGTYAYDHVHVAADLAPGQSDSFDVLAVSDTTSGIYLSRRSVTATTTGASFADGAFTLYVNTYIANPFQLDTMNPLLNTTSPADDAVLASKRPAFAAHVVDDFALSGVQFDLSSGGGPYLQVGATLTTPPFVVMPAADLPEGSHSLRVTATDLAGKSTVQFVNFTVDTAAPTGASVQINSGAHSTRQTSVTLNLAATDLTAMLYRASEQADFAGATWQPMQAGADFTLSAGDGTKTVYVKYRDAAGNSTAPVSAAINLDTTAPAVTAPTAGAVDVALTSLAVTFSEAMAAATLTAENLTLTRVHDATLVTITPGVYVPATHTLPISVTLDPGTAYRLTFAPAVTDVAGNPLAAGDVTFMTEPRGSFGLLTGDLQVPAGVAPDQFAAALRVDLGGSLTASFQENADGTGAYVPGQAVQAGRWFFDLRGDLIHMEAVVPLSDSDYAFQAISGQYVLQRSVRTDRTGTAHLQDGWRLIDTALTPAEGIAFALDETNPTGVVTAPATGAVLTSKRPVITFEAVDNVAVAGTALAMSSDEGQTWQAWDPSTDLVDGAYLVRLTVTDLVGNTGIATVAFTIDTTPPQLGAVTINGGAATSSSRTVPVTVTATDAAQMMISESSAFTGASWQAYAAESSFQLSGGDGLKTVYVKVRDAAGNETAAISRQVRLESPVSPQPPGGVVPTPYVSISAGASETREATISVSGSANPGAQVSVAGQSVTASAGGSWSATAALQEGSNTITATNGSASASVTVLRDSTPPVLSLTASAVQTTEETVTLTATTEAGARVSIAGGTEGTGSATATVTLSMGANTFTATATDRLGNTASQSLRVVRIARPFTRVITPDQPTTVTFENLTVHLPEQVAEEPLQLAIAVPQTNQTTEALTPAVAVVNTVVEVKANLEHSRAPLTILPRRVRLTFAYNPAQVSDPSRLKVYWYDPAGQVWVALSGQVDTTAHTITAEVDHFTLFAVMASKGEAPAVDTVPAQVDAEALTVTGKAAPGATVRLMLNGREERAGQADAAGRFSFAARLQPGRNLLYVKGDGLLASAEAVVAYVVVPQPQPQPVTVLKDVQAHWARTAIERMVGLGVVRGYEDETFRPEQPVTRLEFAVMTARALGLPQAEGTPAFADADQIPQWAHSMLGAAVKAGIIHGRGDGRFDPNALVTRAEVGVILARALKQRGLQAAIAPTAFSDQAAIPAWAQDAVGQALHFRIVTGYEDGSFRPNQQTTRAEAAVLLSRLLDAK